MIESAIGEMAGLMGTKSACQATGRPRATHYRRLRPPQRRERPPAKPQPRALSEAERDQVLEVAHSERFVDCSPPTIFATLLDEGIHLASISTFYRILRSVGEVRERRRQAVHPAAVKPELVAAAPNQIHSWDITKLLGPAKWTYFYLYVIIDIFSRFVVGWMVAERESSELAKILIEQTILKYGLDPNQLTLHADRGSSMASKPVAFLLADLGVTKSHSRLSLATSMGPPRSQKLGTTLGGPGAVTDGNVAPGEGPMSRTGGWSDVGVVGGEVGEEEWLLTVGTRAAEPETVAG